MFLHNSLNGVKAEPCPLPNSFGGKEWFKDVREYLGRNPRTTIANLNHNASVFAVGSNSKVAFSAHRVNSVVNDVGPNLIEFTPKRIHKKRNALVVPRHNHAVFELVVQNRECSLQALYNIDIL